MTNSVLQIQKALRVHTLPVRIKRVSGGYRAELPSKIDANGNCVEWSGLMQCRFDLARRYLAEVYEDSEIAFINLRDAMKTPLFTNRFGALQELSHAMQRAGLI